VAVIASAADLPAPELYLVCGLARDPDREALREVVRLALERLAALRRVGARLDVFAWGTRAKRF
jgi:hypothetical protein